MASGQRVVIFRKIPSFPVPSLFPRELNALAKKAKVFWKYFLQTDVSLLVTLLLAGKHALGGRGKLLGKYIWLGFELLILQGTCALWLSHIRFPENRFTSRASKAGCRTWYKTKSSTLFGIITFLAEQH